MNKMKEVAKLLGVKMNEPFNIKGLKCNPYTLYEDGLFDVGGADTAEILASLLIGEFEIEKPILISKEKQYLENFLKPFKDRVLCITKVELCEDDFCYSYISIKLTSVSDFEGHTFITLPFFRPDEMYKNMEGEKDYTLKDLGLFEE